MNRKERRQMQRNLQKAGLKHEQAKLYVEDTYTNIEYKEGQICRLNYELIIRHPDYKFQPDEFKEWLFNNKNSTLTIDKTYLPNDKSTSKKVINTFKEDDHEPKWEVHSDAIIPIAQAKIKLNNGDQIDVPLGNVTDVNDPSIIEKVNQALEGVE